jgi:hypothetical protein
VGAPRSGGLRSTGQKLATLATHPNPSLEGRGYVLLPPIFVIPAKAGITLFFKGNIEEVGCQPSLA